MGIKVSHVAAVLIAAGVVGWMSSGELIRGGIGPRGEPVIIAERNAQAEEELFTVRTQVMQPEERAETLLLSGRTEADAEIPVRAETGGTLQERLVRKGQFVTAGTEVCRLDAGTRESVLRQAEASKAQAMASLEQAEFDLNSNTQLAERGFAADARLNALRAGADAARAQVAQADAQIAQAMQEIERTIVVANASGFVEDPIAEVGDVLQPGGVCITLVDTDPLLVTGQVPETEIGQLRVGMDANVRLVTGEQAEGTIQFVAASADPETRTFEVDIAIPNPENQLRAGVTASAVVPLQPIEAYPILSSWITLDDSGRIGLGVVNDDRTVEFVPVRVLAQDTDVTWVTGLEPGARVITLGADYVLAGQKVEFVDQPSKELAALRAEPVTLSE